MIEIILDKDGLSPESLDIAETAKFLKAMSDLLCAINPEAKAGGRLVSIESNCVKLGFLMSRQALKAYALFALFQMGLRDDLPNACNNPIRELNRFMSRNEVSMRMSAGKKHGFFLVNCDNRLKDSVATKMKYQTTIYGEVVDAGGSDDPNVHIICNSKKITCHTTKEIAKRLGGRLYETVGLHGEASEENGEIIDFKVSGIDEYEYEAGRDPFLGLRELEKKNKVFFDVDAVKFIAAQRA